MNLKPWQIDSFNQPGSAESAVCIDLDHILQVPLSYFISWMFRTFEDHIEERLTVDIDFDLPDTFQSRVTR